MTSASYPPPGPRFPYPSSDGDGAGLPSSNFTGYSRDQMTFSRRGDAVEPGSRLENQYAPPWGRPPHFPASQQVQYTGSEPSTFAYRNDSTGVGSSFSTPQFSTWVILFSLCFDLLSSCQSISRSPMQSRLSTFSSLEGALGPVSASRPLESGMHLSNILHPHDTSPRDLRSTGLRQEPQAPTRPTYGDVSSPRFEDTRGSAQFTETMQYPLTPVVQFPDDQSDVIDLDESVDASSEASTDSQSLPSDDTFQLWLSSLGAATQTGVERRVASVHESQVDVQPNRPNPEQFQIILMLNWVILELKKETAVGGPALGSSLQAECVRFTSVYATDITQITPTAFPLLFAQLGRFSVTREGSCCCGSSAPRYDSVERRFLLFAPSREQQPFSQDSPHDPHVDHGNECCPCRHTDGGNIGAFAA